HRRGGNTGRGILVRERRGRGGASTARNTTCERAGVMNSSMVDVRGMHKNRQH
ncbi:hypothetical protein B0H10DRAFT_2154178, partial [Mycena sp. CBHHK59/15]